MNVEHDGMAWVGWITEVTPIEKADKIQRVVVDAGTGGKWSGVTPKSYLYGDVVIVFLPDAIVPQNADFAFMEKRNWRVKPMRLRGCPSEVLIMSIYDMRETIKNPEPYNNMVGCDVTHELGVLKYEKEIPAQMRGDTAGGFPNFIPKTDEPNYQIVLEMVRYISKRDWYATLKYDGTSCTAYKYNGHFGVCSRNYEMKDGPNVYWEMARKYDLENKLPDGNAIQFEIYGPGINGNHMGVSERQIAVFNVFDIPAQLYENWYQVVSFCEQHDIPVVDEVYSTTLCNDIDITNTENLRKLAEQIYQNGQPAEGIVVRPLYEETVDIDGVKRLSFKVLNLLYGQ